MSDRGAALDPSADRNVATVRRLASVPSIFRLLRLVTDLDLLAVARVTESNWMACAVLDESGFGMRPGTTLDIESTICNQVRRETRPVAVDDAATDPVYREHEFFRRYPFRSYIAEPIMLSSGACFGTLCAMGTRPAKVSDVKTLALFRHFADQIGSEIDALWRVDAMTRELDDERAGGASREQFMAVLGHDLRNPMASISAAAHVIKIRRSEPDVVSDLSSRIVVTIQRMTAMIDDLLDLARGRLAGGISVSLAPVQGLQTALEDVVDELRGAHEHRLITTNIAIAGTVTCDKGRLQQLLSNLVANALTHGAPDTPVEVVARVTTDRLEIRVRNEGRPIHPDSIAGIFDAFARLDSPAGSRSGLGLGLFICEQIVRAHRGELAVHSTDADGTVFTASMPVL